MRKHQSLWDCRSFPKFLQENPVSFFQKHKKVYFDILLNESFKVTFLSTLKNANSWEDTVKRSDMKESDLFPTQAYSGREEVKRYKKLITFINLSSDFSSKTLWSLPKIWTFVLHWTWLLWKWDPPISNPVQDNTSTDETRKYMCLLGFEPTIIFLEFSNILRALKHDNQCLNY